jgi:hypothetical protein
MTCVAALWAIQGPGGALQTRCRGSGAWRQWQATTRWPSARRFISASDTRLPPFCPLSLPPSRSPRSV